MKIFKRKKVKKISCPFCGTEMKKQKDRYICTKCFAELKGDTVIFHKINQDFQS